MRCIYEWLKKDQYTTCSHRWIWPERWVKRTSSFNYWQVWWTPVSSVETAQKLINRYKKNPEAKKTIHDYLPRGFSQFQTNYLVVPSQIRAGVCTSQYNSTPRSCDLATQSLVTWHDQERAPVDQSGCSVLAWHVQS